MSFLRKNLGAKMKPWLVNEIVPKCPVCNYGPLSYEGEHYKTKKPLFYLACGCDVFVDKWHSKDEAIASWKKRCEEREKELKDRKDRIEGAYLWGRKDS